MALATVPPELTLLILPHLDHEAWSIRESRGDLCALTLTCRRLHAVVNPVLWSLIRVTIASDDTGPNAGDATRMSQLNAACRAKESLLHHVRSAFISWRFRESGPPVAPDFAELLSHLGKARGMSFLFISYGGGLSAAMLPGLFLPAAKDQEEKRRQQQHGAASGVFSSLHTLLVHVDSGDEDKHRRTWIPRECIERLACLPSLEVMHLSAPLASFVDEKDEPFRRLKSVVICDTRPGAHQDR